MGPEAQRERAEFAADWVLNKVNATDAQRTQVKVDRRGRRCRISCPCESSTASTAKRSLRR